jgi:hypothetical protein
MYVIISIRYTSPAGTILQQGDFRLKGRKPEQVALLWWKQIQKEVYTDELIEVIANNEDITEKVRALLEK